MTLTEIKRRVKPGQWYRVTSQRYEMAFGPVSVLVKRTANYGFVVEHALGETKISWPPARFVTRDEDGTLHLGRAGEHAGEPYLTLVPIAAEASRG